MKILLQILAVASSSQGRENAGGSAEELSNVHSRGFG